MAVDQFRRWFESVHYNPCTGATSIPPVDWASVEARMFIWPEGQPHPYFHRSDSDELRQRLAEDEATRTAWGSLDADVRNEILALATIVQHEDTHRVDMLTTPLGAAVAVGSLFGYLELEKLAPELASAEDDLLGEPLIQLEAVKQNMVKRLALPLSFRRHEPYAKQGWPNGIDQVPLWGSSYPTVTVLEQFETLRTSDRPPTYLTLRAILEARGLAHALRRVRWLFGYDSRVAGREMAGYLQSFYADQLQWHDYRFLFDVIAHAAGQDGFEQLLREAAKRDDARLIEQFAVLLSTLCWAALHGTDPVVRLWVANRYAEQRLSGRRGDGPVWQHMGELLNDYDRWLIDGGGHGVREVLAESLSHVAAGRAAADEIADPQARGHFAKLMDTLAFQLQRRVDTDEGFASAMGLTYDGDPLHGGVDLHDAVSLVTLLTGDELDALVDDRTRPIEPAEPPSSLERWSEQFPLLVLYRAGDVNQRREWLIEHYRIDHAVCPRCLELVPVSGWRRRQRIRCPACGAAHDVNLDEATSI
jgi:hypothetical protein